MISQGFLQDLLARADIVDVVGRAVQLKKAGVNYKGLCPFHGEKSPSFSVSPTRQTYHCFGCGVHGNAVDFLKEHGGLGFIDAVKELAQELGVTVPDDERDPRERERAAQTRQQQASLVDLLAKACRHYRIQLRESSRAIDYLKGRGLTGEIAARFGLGYAPGGWHALASAFGEYDDPKLVEAGLVITPDNDSADKSDKRRYDRFRDRIMFPIRNPKGEVIGFGGRVLDKGEPKYLNSPETPVFSKGRELYGLFEGRAAIRQRGYILVTEGYMDVVALAQLGFGNAVATLGTACTGEHIVKLLRFSEQIIFSFDGDTAGRRAAGRALEAVLPHASDTRSFRFLFLPAEHDPDSFIRERGADAFEICVRDALTLSRQLLAVAGENCDLSQPEGRARMLAQARPLHELLPEGLLKVQLLGEIAREGQLSTEVLLTHWSASARRSEPRRGGGAPSPQSTDAGPPHWDDIPLSSDAASQRAAHWEPPAPGRSPDDPNDLGYDPMDDGTPAHARDWRRDRGSPESRNRRAFKENRSTGPQRSNPGAGALPRRQLRVTTSLDLAVWFLVHNMELWLDIPSDIHDLLVQQPAPYGVFFAFLERTLHNEGALPIDAVLKTMDAEATEDGFKPIVSRIKRLLELGDNAPVAAELSIIVDRLRLEQVKDECNECNLLIASGLHSEEDRQRASDLNTMRTELVARLNRLGAV